MASTSYSTPTPNRARLTISPPTTLSTSHSSTVPASGLPSPAKPASSPDRVTVKKYYSPALKAWLGDLGDGTHDGGEDDPRIGVIRVEAKTATYQIARKTMVGRAVEMVQGVVTGDTPAVGKLREISENEISEWRWSH